MLNTIYNIQNANAGIHDNSNITVIMYTRVYVTSFLYYTVTSEYSKRITFSRSFGAISI